VGGDHTNWGEAPRGAASAGQVVPLWWRTSTPGQRSGQDHAATTGHRAKPEEVPRFGTLVLMEQEEGDVLLRGLSAICRPVLKPGTGRLVLNNNVTGAAEEMTHVAVTCVGLFLHKGMAAWAPGGNNWRGAGRRYCTGPIKTCTSTSAEP
jgi:hypothetical protein